MIFIRGVLENNHGSISKAITLIENNQPLSELFLMKFTIKEKMQLE